MPILITVLIFLLTALSLLLLRTFRPGFRYSWVLAVTGALFASISVIVWRFEMPILLYLPSWEPSTLFTDSPLFLVDLSSWPYAYSLVILILGTLITAVARQNLSNTVIWSAILGLGSVGLLAVLADNPLTLVLSWTAIDIAELVTLLASVKDRGLRERVVISFTTRVLGSSFMLWANFVSVAAGGSLNFVAAPSQAGIYMLIAAGLRLGVLPMHLPFRTESALRRGFGTVLRLTSAASSLVLLARIPFASLYSPLIPYILFLVTIAALYSSWMWLRASNILDARPYWTLGMGSLSIASTLHANPDGSIAWGLALILGGGALFLSSIEHIWAKRSILLNIAFMAALPFTITSTGWEYQSNAWWVFTPFLLSAHAFLLAGYFRHARRSQTSSLNVTNLFQGTLYPAGIMIFTASLFGLSITGWEGALNLGAWFLSIVVILLTATLIWARPRIRALNPLEAHWLTPNTETGFNRVYDLFWNVYYAVRKAIEQVTRILESDGGILWAMLFLLIFASLLSGGIR